MKNQLTHNELYSRITQLIEQSRQQVAQSVNLTMVYTYYEIGKYIVEDEQKGEQRAKYGKAVLKELSEQLTERFGNGYSVINLQYMRNFYAMYSNQKYQTLSNKSQNDDIKLDSSLISKNQTHLHFEVL
ncbi:MAG: DUF1016 N-terminal domain-containing protein [Bacteroidales bacterium]|jgi:hypothetical protein|nr:DUF1016 N-terminal domain-containing protein [Bacteroidales bacterium]